MVSSLKLTRGQSLVELMIVIGLCTLLLPVLVSLVATSRSGKPQQQQRTRATAMLKESTEALRLVREKGWDNLALNIGQTVHPTVSSFSYSLSSGSETIGDFTRFITLYPVISAGKTDPSVIRADITVKWAKPIASVVSSTILLSRYLSNDSFVDTTSSQFDQGTLVSTKVDSTIGDGAVILGASGAKDWCSPQGPVTTRDLGGNGLAGNVVAGVDQAYAGTGKNASSKPFYNIKIDNTLNPPGINVAGFYESPGLKANDIFGESHYAYIATGNNSNEEIVIIDVATDTPTFVSSVNVNGNKGSNSVFVSGNILYFIALNNTLYAYDITDRAHPVAKGSLNVGATKKLFVLNNYIYIAQNNTSNQLLIVNASDPSTLTVAATVKVNDLLGVDVFVKADAVSTRAYLVTTSSTTQNNFYIINVNNPHSPSVIAPGYSTSPMSPQGVTVIDNRAIIVGFNRPQYQVIKVDSDHYDWCANTPNTGDPDIDDIYDVSSTYAAGHAYSYIVTTNTSAAFQIIEGGAGGSATYTTFGTFVSRPIDMTNPVFFNRFTASVNLPVGTNIQFQLASAPPVTSCSDAVYTFVGPNGFSDSYYSNNGIIPWTGTGTYQNPARCFKYKAFLYSNGDGSETPVFSDISVNYSP